VLAFFIVFYSNGKFDARKLTVSAVICILYCLCVGKAHLIANAYVLLVLRLLMVALSLYGIRKSIHGKIPFSWPSLKKLVKEEVFWMLFLLICSIPAFVLFGDTLKFIGQGLISALMSFGGGDAYLAVANGLFVNTGMVGYEDFYYKIASVANALPGSILCKILAGVGYVLGYQNGGGMLTGFAVAASGFACSVAASGGTFSAVAYIYERFENLEIFDTLKRYIRPIVAGLLLSVCASMIYQNMTVAMTNNWSVHTMLLLTLGLFGLNAFWKWRGKIRPLYMVLLSACISLAACNLFALV
jgi:chromate transporter